MSLSILAIDGNVCHDASVTVIRDGEIFAVESERLDRVKKSAGHDFRLRHAADGPHYEVFDSGHFAKPIAYCLSLAGLERVDHIIHTHAPKFVRHLGLRQLLRPGGKIQHFPSHHLAHACSAFYYSDFREAAVLVVDGSGHEHGYRFNMLQSSYLFDGTQINAVKRSFATARHQLGIGINYYLHTQLLGMGEGSIMGLSSYGDPTKFPQTMLYQVDGHVYVNPDRLPHAISTSTQEARPSSLLRHYGLSSVAQVDAAKNQIEHSFLADIAASLQHETEQQMIALARELYEVTRVKQLCLAGGVGLNSVANNKLLEHTPFEEIFIQPAAHDAGISLGLALFAHHHLHQEPRRRRPNVFLGKGYSNDEVLRSLERYGHLLRFERQEDVYTEAARMLAEEQVIAWFQGRLEFGPRALGHRSLLGHPGSTRVRDRVNDIKRRQRWRPLAPAVLDDELDRYFEMINHNPYMLLVARVTALTRERAPAVVHVDGTARPQAVREQDNPIFHRLIREFYALSGVPILINTSLNSRGEPLIEHPEQAILFLVNSGVDALVIGDYVVYRRADCPTDGQVAVRVEHVERSWEVIDCDACLRELNAQLRAVQIKQLSFFRGGYNVVLEIEGRVGRRSLDLSFDLDGGRVTRVLRNRNGAALPAKFRPLIAPFVEAFEAYFADHPGQSR